jgi:multiple sugar transport system substrate-binding protein
LEVKDDRPRVDITQVEDELSREELLRRAGAGAIVLVYGGVGAKSAVAGAPRYRKKELKNTLRILQWSHFVPAFDVWFDKTYTKVWGRKNDTDVIVDHISQAELPARVAAEAAARRGHDLVATLAPLPQYEDQVINHKEIVQEVAKKLGKMADVCHRSTYNPRTKRYFGFPDNYAPDPVNYRIDLWREVGAKPTTWDAVLKAAPRLRAKGNPIGLGMSNEIDSNMFLLSLMMCFGSFVQNREGRVTLNSKATREVLKFGRSLYRNGMSDEIFAWTASSNNDAMVAGRLSLAMNAISITRRLELINRDLDSKIGLLPIPKGPKGRLGLEHVMHTYMIWKFAQNKKGAAKFLADLAKTYKGAFLNSKYYNFPSFPRAVPNIGKIVSRDIFQATPKGKYKILDEISRKYTYNVGYPGATNAAIGEMFDTYLIPQMFAEVARGRLDPDDAARRFHNQIGRIFVKWRTRGKV